MAKYIGFVFIFFFYVGFSNKLVIYNGCWQKQLGSVRISSFCYLSLLFLFTFFTISNFPYCWYMFIEDYVLSQLIFRRCCRFTKFFCQANNIAINAIYIFSMAIYHNCFNSLFLIVVIISFIIVFILSENIIPALLLMASKKALTFIMTGKKVFSMPWRQNCKRFFKDWHSLISVFFRDWVISYLYNQNWQVEEIYKIIVVLLILFFILIWIGITL